MVVSVVNPLVSIIMPAYDEEVNISHSLSEILSFLQNKKYTSEIIVVDDGSTDATCSIVNKFARSKFRLRLIKHQKNEGKGMAIRTGMLAAKGKFRILCDADLSTHINHLDFFMRTASSADVVIGSRAIKGSRLLVRQKLHREFMGRIFNFLVQLFLLNGIKDTQCGFKLYSERAAKVIFPLQRIKGWSSDVESLYLARKYGLRIKEVPVIWKNNPESRVSLVIDPIKMLLSIIAIRIYDFLGAYKQRQG